MSSHGSRAASQRGAILIQVAVAMIVLIAFTSFVADYGLLWVGRRQAQNAADAGALAGAVAIAFDNDDRSAAGPAKTAAYNFAIANLVAGETPNVIDPTTGDATDIRFYSEEPSAFPSECSDNNCIRVDVYRNQERGNPLPVWFSQLVGVVDQGVRATAIARVSIANASECVKPWAIPDKWEDWDDNEGVVENPPQEWTADDEYHKKVEQGPNSGTPLAPPDYYRKQGTNGPNDTGTGFTITTDYGRAVTLKFAQGGDAIAPGNFLPVVLPNTAEDCDVGGSCYETNIATCNGVSVGVGDMLVTEPGAKVGPTAHGMQDLIDLDLDAEWDPINEEVINSCAQDPTPCASISPRIVAVPVYHTDDWYEADNGGRTNVVEVVNILGFFLDHMVGNNVVGYFVKMPGLFDDGKGSVAPEAAFLSAIQLVR
jgi:Flp pilus assembly protein TadG